MNDARSVLLIGLDPAVVDFGKWPGMTAEKLAKALEADRKRLEDLGYAAEICFVDHGETAEATVTACLSEKEYAAILVGAGVRTDPDEFRLFETLINVVHRQAPSARICFNTGPTDSVDAVRRWT